jgi:hypothetical protein
MITAAPVKVEKGDILILHTGYHRYYEGCPQQDLVRYFCMHPGGKLRSSNGCSTCRSNGSASIAVG